MGGLNTGRSVILLPEFQFFSANKYVISCLGVSAPEGGNRSAIPTLPFPAPRSPQTLICCSSLFGEYAGRPKRAALHTVPSEILTQHPLAFHSSHLRW